MIRSSDFAYLQHECRRFDIQVTLDLVSGSPRINIMDQQFEDFLPALHYVQVYIAEQGARWLAYKKEHETEVLS